MVFRSDKLIRFHHCDPAGIVFYPQYFVLFHELVEDWFSQGLGIDYAAFVGAQRRGLPMVKVDCEFLGSNRLGDVLALELAVKRLGNSSVTLGIRGSAQGRECVRATLTVVHASLAPSLQALPVEGELRAAMERFREA